MADTSKGLSGTAVGVLTVGALLAYAGFRGISPLQALRDVSSGKPPAVPSTNAGLVVGDSAGQGGSAQSSAVSPQGTAFGKAVANAASGFRSDKYSQGAMQRIGTGYSDCSSFAAKSFRAAGVTSIQSYWTTLSFRTSSKFKVIKTSDASAGDIIITPFATLSGAHMAVVTAPGQAIGQQNSRSNVQTGSFETIMYGKPSFIAMRYVGAIPSKYLNTTTVTINGVPTQVDPTQYYSTGPH